MNQTSLLRPTPWDRAALGMPTWELTEYSPAALQHAARTTGHFTLRVDPLADKKLLHEYGFYYCDTLLEPHCSALNLHTASDHKATISRDIDATQALSICHGAFTHGRFHRDFRIPKAAADLRYDNWLKQLLDADRVYGLYWETGLAGFIACDDNSLVLHALSESNRGKGRAKYWWSLVCNELFAAGHKEVKSSISSTNLAVLNLYTSLGFSFRNPVDVYHRLAP